MADQLLDHLRELYMEVVKDKKKVPVLKNTSKEKADENPVIKAYYALATAMSAESAFNPLKKLDLVSKSSKLFASAASMDKQNPEIRFLRYSVEQNTPKMLGLSGNMENDKQIIIDNIEAVDNEAFKNFILKYMREEADLTEEERSKLP